MAAFANLVAQNARVDFSLREENCLAVLINLQMQNVVRKKKKIKTLPPKIQALIYLLNLYYLLLFFYYSLNPITNNNNNVPYSAYTVLSDEGVESGGGFTSVQNRKFHILSSLTIKVNMEVKQNSTVVVPHNIAIDGVTVVLRDRMQNVDKMEVKANGVLDIYPLSDTDSYTFTEFKVNDGGHVYLRERDSTKYFKTGKFQIGYSDPLVYNSVNVAKFEVFGKFKLETDYLEVWVWENGRILGEGRGYKYMEGPGSSRKHYEGGSHGGTGGGMDHTMSERRGTSLLGYGNFKYPITMGSGGYVQGQLSAANQNLQYSNGGAAIHLNVAHKAYIEGIINVQGQRSYSTSAHYDAGGAGGSVLINTTSLVGNGMIKANGGGHTSQRRSGGGGGRIAVHCSNQNSWKGNGKCGKRINICIPNFKDVTLGLLDEFNTPGTTKQVTYGKSALRNIDRIAGLHTASIDTIINNTSNVNGIQFRSSYMDKEFSVGFMPADQPVSSDYHGQLYLIAFQRNGDGWIKDGVDSNVDDAWLQDDTAPSLIKKISCQYFNGLRLNNDNYVEFLVNGVVVKTSSKKFPSGKNVRIDIQTWDYNAELLNMKYLFRSPITNCYNNFFPCEFTGTCEAYGGDSTEEGHGGHGAPGTIYENCGDVNDRLTISNNHPNNRIVVPDGKTYLVNKANTSRKKLAATLITELRLMNNARVGFEPLKLGRGSNAHLDIGYLLGHKTVLASAVFNLATNPSVADGRNTIFDRGKKILCPHILTALSSNRRCGQDTLY